MMLAARRQKSKALQPYFDLVNYSAGYLYHHLWSETWQTGYSIGVIVRLESALDLVKKMSEQRRDTGTDESIVKKFPKP